MKTDDKKITLGFSPKKFDPGIHICQIYNDDDERHNTLINYIISGIESNEKTTCFTEKESEATLSGLFKEHGFNYRELIDSGKFSISKTGDVYFEHNKFNPERLIDLLMDFYQSSQKDNRKGARVIGEMTPEIEKVEDGTRLLEYEAKVSLLQRKYPVNAVCQYDARKFDGATILEILKVHPYMIVKGNVVSNPFFEKPEDYLEKHNSI